MTFATDLTGWTLAMDQASNQAGASLWRNGKFVSSATLTAIKTDKFSRRLVTLVAQLDEWLDREIGPSAKLNHVVFEGVRSRLVLVTVGAFLTSRHIDASLSPQQSFVETSSWKSWAQKRGATGLFKNIKGITALAETGWVGPTPDSHDAADSILIYLTYSENRGKK
jgi:hypothetical protein